uniref:Uncharacterized protein n=1 Tax=Physcomitrium patens TaxID=3218 RepID=A0A2K1L134_PHYPA|nr:hypothetical protein PHYPA_002526 [Physcomitrium patens]
MNMSRLYGKGSPHHLQCVSKAFLYPESNCLFFSGS